MSVKTEVQRSTLIPHGILNHPPEWDVLNWAFSSLDPWIVGGAARSMYFSLHQIGQTNKDWDLIVSKSKVDQLEDAIKNIKHKGADGVKTQEGALSVDVVTFNGRNETPGPSYVKPKGWTGEISLKDIGVGPKIEGSLKFDIWPDDISDYLIAVPTAFDGIAINMRTKAVVMTQEFSLGKNSLISGRPVSKSVSQELFRLHLARQGL